VTAAVTVDVAGAAMGGAARYVAELRHYLSRTGRGDVLLIGTSQHVSPQWLLRRELRRPASARRIALNNVGFVTPGGERWTLLANALHFPTEAEAASLDPSLRRTARRQAAIVRRAALRSDVLVAPCTAMAERVLHALPSLRSRVAVRPHPISAGSVPAAPAGHRDPLILCPVLFAPYKRMNERLGELVAALRDHGDQSVRVGVTADHAELSPEIALDPHIEVLGRIGHQDLRDVWARSRAVYFPTALESFGYPLAEARASGRCVIARDTPQNREIAGPALCEFTHGDHESLVRAVKTALTAHVAPDPSPFDPDAYFGWMLGCGS
jgi:glycosyltransferase involved in cell wall biosynthesis